MTQSRLIRVLLAFYLAIWTPLWCSCSAQAAFQSTPHGQEKLAEFGETSESSRLLAKANTYQGLCCTANQAPRPSDHCPSDRTDENPLSPCHDQDDCECGNHTLLLAQPATASMFLSWGSRIDLPQVHYDVLTALLHHETSNGLRISHAIRNCNGGTARTLFAQHTLLLN